MESTVIVNSRGFEGAIRKTWKVELIQQDESVLTLAGIFDAEVNHPRLGFIRRGTISFEYYWLNRWYNVFRFHEPDGSFRNYYCNISMPPIFENRIIDYVDLDIDIVVWKDFTYIVLDEDEYESRAAVFNYPKIVRKNTQNALAELIRLIETKKFPFDYVA